MKTKILLLFLAIGTASCTFENIEPRYDVRDRIVGHYEVEEYSETFNDFTYYSLEICKSNYRNEIRLINFYAAGITVYADLSGDKITIPRQVADGYEIDGVGTVFGNEITMSYRVRDRYSNVPSDYCETRAWMEF